MPWLLAAQAATSALTLACVVFLIRLERRVDRLQANLTTTINAHNVLANKCRTESICTQTVAWQLAEMQRVQGFRPRVQ